MSQLEIVIEGFKQFKERIKPAILSEKHSNGNILAEAARQRGYDLETMTSEEIATALFKVASLDAVLYRLDWTVEPKKLQLLRNETKPQVVKDVHTGSEEFEKNFRKSEKQAEYNKDQADAERQINDMISAFTPVVDGKIRYSLQESVQAHLKSHLAKEKARNADMKGVAKAVAKYLADQYAKLEGPRWA